LPAIRQQIWTLMRAAKMDHDLGLEDRPGEDSFDDMLLHVDGWLVRSRTSRSATGCMCSA